MAGKILPPNTAMVDGRGLPAPEWYRFFVALQTATQAVPSSDEDLAVLIGSMAQGGAGDDGSVWDASLLASPAVVADAEDVLWPIPVFDEPYDFLPPTPMMGLTQEEADARYAPVGATPTFNIRTINATGSPASNDYTLLCDAASAAISVNLPAAAASAKRIFNIKKIDASANAVTIDPNGAELVDGAATLAIPTQWQSMTIQCDGTAWYVI